jgi:molecular chaperone GrpE
VAEQENTPNESGAEQVTAEEHAQDGAQAQEGAEELGQVRAQAQQYLEGWQRERAEFANYRRRTEQERVSSYQNATGDVLKKIIPVIDDFDRAVANIPADLGSNPWVSGTAMIQRKLQKVLDDFGVTIISPQGEVFDPTMHEAVMMEPRDDVESGTIVEVMQKGYKTGDRLLRPALVKVAQ